MNFLIWPHRVKVGIDDLRDENVFSANTGRKRKRRRLRESGEMTFYKSNHNSLLNAHQLHPSDPNTTAMKSSLRHNLLYTTHVSRLLDRLDTVHHQAEH